MGFELQMCEIRRAFGRTLAVDDASIELRSGEVVGLIGENGSGKSTLAQVLCGHLAPDRGVIRINGEEVGFSHPRDAQRVGIALLPQFAELCGNLSVAENITLGREPMRLGALGWIDREAMAEIADNLLEEFGGARIALSAPAAALSGGQKKAVMLARLLRLDPSVIVLDEPSASLGVQQRQSMQAIVVRLRQQGRTVVLISHDVDEVETLCDRIYAMHAGRISSKLDRPQFERETLMSHMSSVAA